MLDANYCQQAGISDCPIVLPVNDWPLHAKSAHDLTVSNVKLDEAFDIAPGIGAVVDEMEFLKQLASRPVAISVKVKKTVTVLLLRAAVLNDDERIVWIVSKSSLTEGSVGRNSDAILTFFNENSRVKSCYIMSFEQVV